MPSRPSRLQQPQLLFAIQLAALLLSAQILPSFMRYLGADSSMAVGTAAATLIILLVFLATQAILGRYHGGLDRRLEFGPFVFATTFVLLAVPHAAIADYFQAIDLARLLKTLPLLFLLLGGGIALGRMLLRAPDRAIDWALALSFGIFSVSVLLKVSGLQPRASEGAFEKSIFPFTETSHFALAFAPVLLYRCIISTGHSRSAWLLLGFGVALVLQSLTLLIGCLLTAIVCRRILIVSLMSLILVLGVMPFELDYFYNRLDLTGDVRNLSSLVYIQGWQLLLESLTRSFGWGVGFQQLGVHGTGVSAADAIVLTTGTDGSNVMDGSFVFAKLAGEFGVFGVLLGLLFLIAVVRSVLALRRERERAAIVFARCVLVSYTVDMFVRGTGYFTGSTLLAITAISILVSNRKRFPFLSKTRVHRYSISA